MKSKKIVIAIDGPAASGKSTTARLVAQTLGYLHIDTGAMYRALTLQVLRSGVAPEDETSVRRIAEEAEISLRRLESGNRVFIKAEDVTDAIRSPEVTKHVSTVSSYQSVRTIMVRQQRQMASEGGVVLEGRDIGTVVFPDADLKVFMVADVHERARRRRKDLQKAGIEAEEVDLVQEITDRDRKDSTRQASPLRRAEDAFDVDTSHLSITQQVELIVRRAKEIIQEHS